ncbi:MAG TPA: HlyD family secretion protein [Methylomirabilota bacterium]|jgi:membrane fusion protein (multidrug efflux system)|nr:HlyD family secretion protein [Methylomirabilota bacterium]
MGRRVVIALAVLVALAALGWGGLVWYHSWTRVSTDDAYVEGTISPVSAKVAGHVVEMLVRDNQAVRRGELLLRVDPRDFVARRDQARATVAVAEADLKAVRAELPMTREVTRAQVDEGRAALEGTNVSVRSSQSAVEEARARLESRRAATAALRAEVAAAESAQRRAAREMERMRQLLKNDYVSRREHDDAESAMETTAAAVEAAQRRLAQSERETQQAEAELASRILGVEQARQKVMEARGGLARVEGQGHQVAVKMAEATRSEARLQQARAELAQAELAVEHTEVRAPVDGVVSKRTVEIGQIVQMGQPLMAIVPLNDVWVVANFKETQLTRVRPGMRAEVEIDGFPGKTFHGVVNSLSAGTGSRFSLLPPENATGNWVKVVQRVPVKILLDGREAGNPQPLRAGMSAVVTIRVK